MCKAVTLAGGIREPLLTCSSFQTVASCSVLLLIPCVRRLEETDQKLMLQSDLTVLHQNQKGRKYLQKLASVQERNTW